MNRLSSRPLRWSGVLVFWMLQVLGSAAVAQTQPPGSMAQRVAVCIACHGREGSASGAGYFPRLAGKPSGYLYNQLLSFRDGRRSNSDMSYLLRNLSDAYLREMADYFAALDLPYPAGVRTSDASLETLERGRQLVLDGDRQRGIPACVGCHASSLTGVQPDVPPLVGLPRLYLASQLGAWITRDRHAMAPDCMARIGRNLTTADVNAVASWLALQPMPADPKPLPSLPRKMPLDCGGPT
ncbi:MAG: putative cytochrome c [Variovorax sp.]|jgi:cytochrome c553|nr:putative cytochrome c [Variovorax sp.]